MDFWLDKDFVKNISKNLSDKHSQKLIDHAKQSARDARFKKSNSKICRNNWSFDW